MAENTHETSTLTLFILVRALPAWLALERSERRRIAGSLPPLADDLRLRQFDCEAFSAMCSDIWMLAGASLETLNAAMERLRDTALFARPYFEFVAILPAIEDGWKRFEAMEGSRD